MEESANLKLFNKFFTDYQGRFIRFANNYVRDWTVAEDFTLEALMAYWEHRHTLLPNTNIPAYVFTIIKNKCLNYLEHLQVKKDVVNQLQLDAEWELQVRITSLEACDPDTIFTTEAEDIINRTIAKLPEQTRKIFIMSRFENKSHKEIAGITGMTTKGVEFHISKALKILRNNLKDYMPILLYFFY